MPDQTYVLQFIVEGKDNASAPLGGVGGALQSIAEFAAGDLLAGGIRKIGEAVFNLGKEALDSTGELQNMRLALDTLAAREAVLAGAFDTVEEALQGTAGAGSILLDRMRELSIASPFEYQQVADTYRLSMAFGAGSDAAADLTKATLDVGAGLGLTNEMLGRTSYNLMQAIVAGDLTGANLRQLKMVGIDLAGVLKGELGLSIEQVRSQLQAGKITLADVADAFVKYSEKNFGGAAERMSRTFQGLKSSINDLFFFASADLLTPALEEVTGALGELFDGARSIVDSGLLREIGAQLGNVTRSAIEAGKNFASEWGGRLAQAAESSLRWGIEISTELAVGMVQGAAAALTWAMDMIGNMLSGWLAPGSPPKVAPYLDDWGAEAMTIFLHGMTEAEWGVMNSVQGALESAMRTLVSTGMIAEDAFGPTMIALSKDMAGAMAAYAESGDRANAQLLDLRESLAGIGGDFGPELVKLLDLQLDLVDATKEYERALAAVAAAREAENKAEENLMRLETEYNELLAHRAPMRDVRAKKAELDAARAAFTQAEEQRKAEEEALKQAEERKNTLGDQANWQQQLLDQLRQMHEWNTRILEDEKEKAGKKKKGAGEMPAFPIPDWKPLEAAVDGLATSPLMEKMKGLFSPVTEAWKNDIQPTLDALGAKWDWFTGIVSAFWNERVQPVIDDIIKLIPPDLMTNIANTTGLVLGLAVGAGILFAALILLVNPLTILIATMVLVRTAWEEDWLGIRTAVTDAADVMIPAWTDFKTWLDTTLPEAMQMYRDGWDKTYGQLIPPTENLLRNFIDLVLADLDWWIRTINDALTILGGILNDTIIPFWTKLVDKIVLDVNPALDGLKTFIDPIVGTFNNLAGAIQGVADWLGRMAEKIRTLPSLPDFINPGSPTPFELGLRGVSDAMRDLTKTEMPRLEAGLAFASVPGNRGERSYEQPAQSVLHINNLNLYGVQDADSLLHRLQQLSVPGVA